MAMIFAAAQVGLLAAELEARGFSPGSVSSFWS
jgi:hypothetical protein